MYFNNVKTLAELKSQYRKLAFSLHPDRGGDAKAFSAMQLEYERLFADLKNRPQNDTEEATGAANDENYTSDSTASANDVDDGFKDIIEILIHLAGINIELCGEWLWLSGNTKEHKETLKAAGCKWAAKKKMWYWRPADAKQWHNRRHHSMAYIRAKYGSVTITAEEKEKLNGVA